MARTPQQTEYNKTYRAKNLEERRADDKAYYEANKAKKLAAGSVWRAANPERALQYKREWRDRVAHTRAFKAKQAKWNHSEAAYARRARYNATEKAKVTRANAAARRAARLSASQSPGLTLAAWREICETFGDRCAYCLEAKPLTRDHVIPIASGGRDEYTNVVPACVSCNSSKSNSILPLWYGLKFG